MSKNSSIPKVSVIVRAKDEENGLLLETVRVIDEQEFAEGFEVILVFRTLAPETIQALSRYPRVRCLSDEPVRPCCPARLLNYGIARAKGKWIVSCNADAVPANPSWLMKLVSPLEQEQVIAVYGRQIPRPSASPLVQKDYLRAYGLKPKLQTNEWWFSNVNSAFRHVAWEKRPFQEDAGVAEDMDFGFWAIKQGYKIYYEPEASVFHSHDYTLRELYEVGYQEGRSFRYLHNRRLSLPEFLFRYGGILAHDFLWLLSRGRPWSFWRSPLSRLCRRYGLYRGSHA